VLNIEHAICVSASQAKILAKLDCCQGLCQGLCQRLCQDLRQGSPPNIYAKTYAKDYAKVCAKDRNSGSSQAECLPRNMPRFVPRFVPRMIPQIGVRLNMCQGFCQGFCQWFCQGLALKFFHVLLTCLSKRLLCPNQKPCLFWWPGSVQAFLSLCISLAPGGLGLRMLPLWLGRLSHINLQSCWACTLPGQFSKQQKQQQNCLECITFLTEIQKDPMKLLA